MATWLIPVIDSGTGTSSKVNPKISMWSLRKRNLFPTEPEQERKTAGAADVITQTQGQPGAVLGGVRKRPESTVTSGAFQL